MNVELIELIKKTTIKALFADDALRERFVLTGGNALDLFYSFASRSSIDIDVTMADDFPQKDLPMISQRIAYWLTDLFGEIGFLVIDYQFRRKPKHARRQQPNFWGGYEIKFKIVSRENFTRYHDNEKHLRNSAVVLSSDNKRTFKIDISKYDYCEPALTKDLDGFVINVYSPEMMVCEKLRAICQQLPSYLHNKNTKSPRARDFYDIYTIVAEANVNPAASLCSQFLPRVFAAKDVDLQLLSQVRNSYTYHLEDFSSVLGSLPTNVKKRSFRTYFDFVVKFIEALKIAGNE